MCFTSKATDLEYIETQNIEPSGENIVVYTLGTNMNVYLHNMVSSLRNHDYKYKVLGLGKKWGGWVWRMKQYMEAADAHYDENTPIIFVDGYDAFAIKDSKGLLDKFKSVNRRIVTGAELGNPFVSNYGRVHKWWFANQLKEEDYSHIACNAGFVMGYPKDLYNMYKWIIDNGYADDQVGLRNFINTYPEKVYLDYKSEFVFTKLSIENENTFNSYFLHLTGLKTCSSVGISFDSYYAKYIPNYKQIFPIQMNEDTSLKLDVLIVLSILGIIGTTMFL